MGGHRGTGGGDGQEHGGMIVAELKSPLPNVMYADRLRTMSRHRGAGRGMYVCMYVCMYVHTIVEGMACMCSIYLYYPASLTLSLSVMSAPCCCRRSEQVAVRPLPAAQWRAVHPFYNNREIERQRERETDQTRDTQDRNTDAKIEEDSRTG